MKNTAKRLLVVMLVLVLALSIVALVACKLPNSPNTPNNPNDNNTQQGNNQQQGNNNQQQGGNNSNQGGSNPAKPTFTVNANGGTVGDFTVNSNGTLTPPSTTPTKDGYIFDGYFKDAECTIAWNFDTDKVTVDITVTIYIRWKPQGGNTPITKPTVTVNTNGGNFSGSITVNDDNTITEPTTIPTKPNYKFDGWYKDEDCTIKWNFETDKVTVNITIYIKWIRVYTVTFDTNGGSLISSIEVDENTTIAKPTDPTKDGYTFDAWYEDEDSAIEWDFNSKPIIKDTTLYAKWLSFFNVTFISNGGNDIDALTSIKENTQINEPSTPIRNGYKFGGWYKDSAFINIWNFNTDSVIDNTILYAKWIALFTVTFETNGGSDVSPLYDVEANSTISEPMNPTKEDYIFESWCSDVRLQNIWNFDTHTITRDTKLYARWRDPVGGTSGLNYVYNYQDNTYHVSGIGFATDSQIRIPSLYQGLPVSVIRYDAFLNNTSITSVTIPKSVTSIGASAFSGCTNLFEVTLDEGLWYIGTSAFKDCKWLTSIDIPSSVTSLAAGVFSGCSCLQNITLSSLSAFSPYPFGYIFGENSYSNGVATEQYYEDYNGNTKYSTYYIPASLKNVTIARGTIPNSAFYKCGNLENVKIPEDATQIGADAFDRCSNLKSVNIPDSVTKIGSWAFADCSNLTSITLPDSVTSIGKSAFYGCKKLTSIKIPEKVTIINDSLLRFCDNLTSVTVGKNITYISSYAFASSSKLNCLSFEGTIEEWNQIQKSSYWKSLSSLTTVICADGEIKLK